jgi:hypothetical protein
MSSRFATGAGALGAQLARHAHHPASLALAVVLMLALWCADSARAGTYPVYACSFGGGNASWQAVQGPNGYVAADTSCNGGDLWVRNSVAVNQPASIFTEGYAVFNAPAGTVLTGIHADYQGVNENGISGLGGWAAGIYDNHGWFWCVPGQSCNTFNTRMHIDLGGRSGSYFRLSVQCGAGSCTRDSVHGKISLSNVQVDVFDSSLPGLSAGRGALWTRNGWMTGVQDVGFNADDNVGIKVIAANIDGRGDAEFSRSSGSSCNYFYPVPCPNRQWDTTFNLGGLSDGAHSVHLNALDTADNWGNEAVRTIYVDNNAPAMGAVALQADSAWKTTDTFTVATPASDVAGGSGVQSLTYDLCHLDNTACVTRTVSGGPATTDIQVPGPGEWKARFRANDALRSSAWSDWTAPMRFDNVPPGQAVPDKRNGWISKDEEYYVRKPVGQPPASGIAGYAITTDGSEPGAVATSDALHDGASEPARVDLAQLTNGVHVVRARAITGSGVPSQLVGEEIVRIDRVAPSLTITGAPSGTQPVSRNVALALIGTDQPGLSGMDPAPTADPDDTHGGYLDFELDGGATQRVRGDNAQLTLTSDGTHVLTARAYDVAGNRTDTQTVRVAIDKTPPIGGLEPGDPANPRLISFFISDACVRSAQIQIHPANQVWRDLDTTLQGDHATATVPDDLWDVRGIYDVRAIVTDCAGNVSVLDRMWAGPAAGGQAAIALKPRIKTVLAAAFTPRALAKKCVTTRRAVIVRVRKGHRLVRRAVIKTRKVCPRPPVQVGSSAKTVLGTLLTDNGTPVSGQAIDVEVRVATSTAPWTRVGTTRTDVRGNVSFPMRNGPSREVRLVFQKTEELAEAVSTILRTQVTADSTILASRTRLRNGQSVTLRGTLLGGYVPSGGRELELQGYNPAKHRWQPVVTSGLRFDSVGRWRASYRFTATRGTVTYRFRLRIVARPDHPFATGYSKAVAITVHG